MPRIPSKQISSKPKVLFIAPFPPPASGVSNVMQGFWDSPLREQYALRRLDIKRLAPAHVRGRLRLDNSISTLLHWAQALRIAVRWRPDIINVVYTSYFATAKAMGFALIGRLCGARVLGHLHGGAFDKFYSQQRRLLRTLIRLTLRPVDAWVVTAVYWQQVMISLGVEESRISIIPNPQREEVFAQSPKKDYAVVGGIPRLLFVGAVSRRKGVDVLIEALSLWSHDGGLFRVCVLGAEESLGERSELLDLCCERLLGDRFDFQERLEGEAYFHLLRMSDIFVLPSRNENYPMALCEAMALGLPVIGTSIGGVSDLIIDNQSGLLIPPGDPAALARAVSRLAGDLALRRRLGQAARSTVLRDLTPERAGQALGVAFDSLL